MSRSKRAFTLIELLVVVAIIALLIAILLPSLARAKRQAQQTADLSNIRSVCLAMSTYDSEYNRLPPPRIPGGINANSTNWIADPIWAILTTTYKIPFTSYGCNTFGTIQAYWATPIGLYTTNHKGSGSSVVGWNYLVDRVDASGNPMKYIDMNGASVGYVMPISIRSQASSRVILTCMNYDAATGGENWESVAPHINGGSAYMPAGTSTYTKPEGMCAAFIDCSASYVKIADTTTMKNPANDQSYIPKPWMYH